jgi:hypothetical protein
MDPDSDPAFFVFDLHLHHFSKIKSKRSHKTEGNKVFLTVLSLLYDRRIRIRIHTSD